MQRLKKLIERYTIVPESISNRITMEFQLCQGIAGIDRWATKLSQIPFDLPKDRLERQIKSYFFELDVMAKLYQSEDVQSMTYEPKPLSEGGKNCDLMVETGESNYLFEIKSFNPENKSRELHTQYFPKHISVDIDTRVYYDDFTIRSDLIQRAFEEGKGDRQNMSCSKNAYNLLTVVALELEIIRS